MSQVADRLLSAGYELPAPPAPAGLYLPAIVSGQLVFTAGQLPLAGGSLVVSGVVGDKVSEDAARECAATCALNALAAAATVCDIDSVTRVVKLVCYVASTPDFQAQPAVANGASEVMVAAFGDDGRHAREAVGVSALPLGAPVEVSLVLEVR